jgi:glycosyltransferase involved in cell wall biosynthesis
MNPAEATISLGTKEGMKMARICLAMVVRNDSAVIDQYLDRALAHITHWVVVDAGSKDGSIEVVRAKLGHLPGAVYEREWQDPSTNREQLLQLAHGVGDSILLLDTDLDPQ